MCVCLYMYKENSRRLQMVEGLTIHSLVSKLYFIQCVLFRISCSEYLLFL